MLIMRPVRETDLEDVVALTRLAGYGLSTLPCDREFLEQRVMQSAASFSNLTLQPKGENYLFVLVDTDLPKVVGTSGIVSKVGGFEPFYAYRIQETPVHSDILDVHKNIRCLHLVEEHNGPAEIGSLFLHPDYRGRGLSPLLSCSRFLFMAEYPARFETRVIAELRGVVDDEGRAPFWEAVGRHFFDVDYSKADYLSSKTKQFIADLMPRHPLYIDLLPFSAQKVIGQVHQRTVAAKHLLEKEGFEMTDLVDIFEAGPIVHCERDTIDSVRRSRNARVSRITKTLENGQAVLLAGTRGEFRVTRTEITQIDDESIAITRETAEGLNLEEQAPVRYVPVQPDESAPGIPR